tara:strand:- start:2518 stop:2697 length:180 start_codon:yes stop_codon:yes gene_type:complete
MLSYTNDKATADRMQIIVKVEVNLKVSFILIILNLNPFKCYAQKSLKLFWLGDKVLFFF